MAYNIFRGRVIDEKKRSHRIAGILHIFNQCFNMLDGKTTLGNWDTEINMETLRGATALAEYFALQKEILFAKVSRQQKRC